MIFYVDYKWIGFRLNHMKAGQKTPLCRTDMILCCIVLLFLIWVLGMHIVNHRPQVVIFSFNDNKNGVDPGL